MRGRKNLYSHCAIFAALFLVWSSGVRADDFSKQKDTAKPAIDTIKPKLPQLADDRWGGEEAKQICQDSAEGKDFSLLRGPFKIEAVGPHVRVYEGASVSVKGSTIEPGDGPMVLYGNQPISEMGRPSSNDIDGCSNRLISVVGRNLVQIQLAGHWRPSEVLATRSFMEPHDIPPTNFAAYGIVAFPQMATPKTAQRYVDVCEAYVASLLPTAGVQAKPKDQMVTVWPVASMELATKLEDRANCKNAVEFYSLPTALTALKEARTAEGKALDGEGPYLLAWAPSSQKGKKGAIVLTFDLSEAKADKEFSRYFRDWRSKIERNPDLWLPEGWSLERLRIVVRDWADQWGTMLLSVGRATEGHD